MWIHFFFFLLIIFFFFSLAYLQGIHPDFTEHAHQMEKIRTEKLQISEVWKNYWLQTIERNYQNECETIENDFVVKFIFYFI